MTEAAMERWMHLFIDGLKAGKDPSTCARMYAGMPLQMVMTYVESVPEFGAAWDALAPTGRDSLTELRVLTPSTYEALLWAQCTHEEAAAYFGLTVDELDARIGGDAALARVNDLARIGGRAAIRVAQHEKALQGDSQMLIWQGKQALGQADKVEAKVETPQLGAPVTLNQIILQGLPEDTLTALLEKAMAGGDAVEAPALPDIEGESVRVDVPVAPDTPRRAEVKWRG